MIRSVSRVDLGAAEFKEYDHEGAPGIKRERTKLEHEVLARHDEAEAFIAGLGGQAGDPTKVYFPSVLEGAIFCGHLVTDMDSIAGAIGAADLYGGVAARASEVNSETVFCLEHWGLAKPPPIEEVLLSLPDAGVCLVDHQQTSQLNPAIPTKRIVGVIDHHALQSETIVTEMPIFIDIRPWGSMSSIITHGYLAAGRKPPRGIAGMLLCAIISDTLNLQGPTTTYWDKTMVAILAIIAGVEDINLLASAQFKAKSKDLFGLSATQLCSGDCKVFKLAGPGGKVYKVGFVVVETTDDAVIMDRKAELLPELLLGKKEKGVDFLFLAVVNIVVMRSNLLLCDVPEKALATLAFGGDMVDLGVMDLGARVSRKKEFVPPLTASIGEFVMPTLAKRQTPSNVNLVALAGGGFDERSTLFVDPTDPLGRVQRMSGDQSKSPAAGPAAAKETADLPSPPDLELNVFSELDLEQAPGF
jgi:inorganic pyrophosphatase/exopolyphosphatase